LGAEGKRVDGRGESGSRVGRSRGRVSSHNAKVDYRRSRAGSNLDRGRRTSSTAEYWTEIGGDLITMSVQRRELASTEGGGGQAGVNRWVANLKRHPATATWFRGICFRALPHVLDEVTAETLALFVLVPTIPHPVYRHLMSAGQRPASHSAAGKDTRARRRGLSGAWDAVAGDRCEVPVVKDIKRVATTRRPTSAVSMAFGLGSGFHGFSYPVLLANAPHLFASFPRLTRSVTLY
jgi:hypothetical protein